MTDHDNAYDGLLGGDERQWAFGTATPELQGEDPLAGVDTTIPDGVDAQALAAYCVMLGDDALICSHRLSQWTSNAPDLEENIALANIALDLLGQARLLLTRAAATDPAVVPALPEGSPVPAEDALAFFRDEGAFRNVRLVEPDDAHRGDFGVMIARLLIFSCYRHTLLERLATSRDAVLAAVAAKGIKEVAYHRDYAARWFVTLAQGTEESRRRVVAGLDLVMPLHDELFRTHPVEAVVAEQGVGVDPALLEPEVGAVLDQVLSVARVDRPDLPRTGSVAGGVGRDGRHSEEMGRLLAEMQSVARAHPLGLW